MTLYINFKRIEWIKIWIRKDGKDEFIFLCDFLRIYLYIVDSNMTEFEYIETLAKY